MHSVTVLTAYIRNSALRVWPKRAREATLIYTKPA